MCTYLFNIVTMRVFTKYPWLEEGNFHAVTDMIALK